MEWRQSPHQAFDKLRRNLSQAEMRAVIKEQMAEISELQSENQELKRLLQEKNTCATAPPDPLVVCRMLRLHACRVLRLRVLRLRVLRSHARLDLRAPMEVPEFMVAEFIAGEAAML